MTTNNQSAAAVLAGTVGAIAAILVGIIWGGWWAGLSVSMRWGWFAVPMFGLPALSVWQAFGLVWLVRALAHRCGQDDKKAWQQVLDEAWLLPPLLAGLFLGAGWVVRALV